MFDLATRAGAGDYNRWAAEMAQRQAAQQQQAESQERSIAANLYSQQAAAQNQAARQAQQQQYGAMQQAAQFAQQNAYQQQGAENQLAVANQYGMNQTHAQALDDIRKLEAAGHQYTPFQQKKQQELEDAWDKVAHDDAVGPAQRASAWNQYLDQKARIIPRQPPPKTRQQMFDESVVKFAHPVTGEEVFGTMGERNGVPTFDPIEFQGAKEQQKVQLEQQKAQSKIEVDRAKATQDAQIKAAKAQQDLELKQAEIERKRRQQVQDEYYKMEDEVFKLKTAAPPKVETGGDAAGATAEHKRMVEERVGQVQDEYRRVYGDELAQINPGLARKGGMSRGQMQGARPPSNEEIVPEQSIAPGTRKQNQLGETYTYDGQQWQREQAQQPPAQEPEPPEMKQARDAMIEYLKNLPEPQSQQEWAKLPPGTKYMKDGKVYIKR
jgi:hypothetical protein